MAKKVFSVEVKAEWCKACGICVALCPVKIITPMHDGRVEVKDQEKCTGCNTCVIHCPDFCFEVKEQKND